MTKSGTKRALVRVDVDRSVGVDPSTVTVVTDEKVWSGTRARPMPMVVSPPLPNAQTNAILVIDRRQFVRGCLTSWLGSFGEEFQALPEADIEMVMEDALKQAAVVLFGFDHTNKADHWLSNQVEWLRERRPDVPIMLLMETADVTSSAAGEPLAIGLAVQGYIPTSSSLEVAAAALRLVVAGGHYFPRLSHATEPPQLVPIGQTQLILRDQSIEKLTPREEAVLSALATGTANKIIAYQLGMSVSTVKAHVHSIFRKLKVRNRTEAVVAARTRET